ncbi:uncharacterized protein LOC111890233 [Lactuca sativa]|uniref:uncharacterized protein LOC111890233 n=1 Tax=Lactuca sativa TaxID=4236 RepID=UPI000CD899B2|nr:uncharacterized protein LOC111890233 [Lactuca sativa]
MVNFNMNTMTSFSHMLGSSTKIPMLIPEYYDHWANRMEDYLNGLDEELWSCISGTAQPPSNVQYIGSSGSTPAVTEQSSILKNNEKRCMRELRGALPPVVYNYVRVCKTANDICNTLKEKFQGSEKTKINSVKQCFVELKEFKQKDNETIESYYDRLNELIYKCNRFGITRSTMEFNLTFIVGLREEWRSVTLMVKTQSSFDTSSLNKLYNLLKTHEGEVNEMAEESKLILGGPLALVSKVTEKESIEKDNSYEEGFLMNLDNEAVAFYSKNRVKKFFKKPFNPKMKQGDAKGSFVNKSAGEEKKKFEKNEAKTDESKAETKIKGDSGIDCHYCHGVNRMASDCMLRKKDVKKNKVKDKDYYEERLEEVRAKAKGMSLVARGEGEDDGTYQIWSSR